MARKLTQYQKFVKANWKKTSGTPQEKMKRIGKLWRKE